MPLNLPVNFKNDIQSRDTALVPAIWIGNYGDSPDDNIYLSTNSFSFTDFGGVSTGLVANFMPLLLNIPSLKESINISTRKYSIGSVNLDISNYEYNGQRFSELVGDRSLINTECRIFWVSPSVGDIQLLDIELQTNPDALQDPQYYNVAMQVYSGTIRRYTHDDEKARLVVEDRSQATLHKDLPIENLGMGAEVPDKYKNKPIPMVYGHVDRSPCVIKNQLSTSGDGSEIIIVGDNPNIISSIDEFKIFGNDVYVNVLPVMGASLSAEYDYDSRFTEQYIIEDKQIKVKLLYGETVDNSEGETNTLSNTISDNFAGVYLYSKVNNIKLFTASDQVTDFFTFQGQAVVGGATLNYGAANVGDSVTISFSGVGGTYNLYKISYSFEEPPQSLDNRFYRIIKATNISLQKDNEGSGENIVLFFGNASGGLHPLYYPGIPNSGVADSTDLTFIESTKNNIAVLNTDSSVNKNQEWEQQWRDGWGGINVLLASTVSANSDVQASLNIGSMEIITYYLVDKFIESDFYANVNGRVANYPSAPDIISHIMVTELNQEPIDVPAGYTDWDYAFTVDKKINSKKLIENIASASPYIPRFNNMGKFKFDVIPEDGGTITSDDHTIKNADVIDFSFSRTTIEDVYTKVIFKYNWDYAREEFNSSIGDKEYDISTDHLFDEATYKLDYYGLNPDHSESTLIIDDDRGKFIRDDGTALDFAMWYLMWSCNQKLKMKIKLPLNYMFLEIGDNIKISNPVDGVLGGVNPYGINYTLEGKTVNGQTVFTNFLIINTNKTLEFCEIECVQLHNLDPACFWGCDYQCYDSLDDAPVDNVCGVCGGGEPTEECGCADIPYGACDCNGNVLDGCGVCGGTGTALDVCGICDGTGTFCIANPEIRVNGAIVLEDGTAIVPFNEVVTIDATGSTVPDNSSLMYGFSQIDGIEVVLDCDGDTGNFVGCSGGIATFTSPDILDTIMEFRLTVVSEDYTPPIIPSIGFKIKTSEHIPPTADAGVDQEVFQNTYFELNGSGSYAVDYTEIEVWAWKAHSDNAKEEYGTGELYSCDDESCTGILGLTAPLITDAYVPLADRTYTFQLEIVDMRGGYATDLVTIIFDYRECDGTIGDVNDNGGWNDLDLVILSNCVELDNCEDTLLQPCTGDLNGDGVIDYDDVLALAQCIMDDNCGQYS